jgi:hypothetical protein
MAWRGDADATRHPAEDYSMIIPYVRGFAQGSQGAPYPARPPRLPRPTGRSRDVTVSAPQWRRAAQW